MPDFGDNSPREGYGAVDPYARSLPPDEWAAYQAKRRKDAILGIIGTVGGATALGAAPALFGAGGAAGSAGSAGAVNGMQIIPHAATVGMNAPAAAGATASRFSLSNFLDLGKLAANLFGSISGNKANANAQAATLAETKREFDEQQRILAENEATRKAEALRTSDELARQWEAGQQFEGQKFRATEEQRLHDRAIADAAEARKAPRRALSQQALMSLSQFLGLGRR